MTTGEGSSGLPDDELAEFFDEPAKEPTCPVFLLPLTGEQRRRLEKALARPRQQITGAKIARVVTGWGYPVKDWQINSHRRGECSCLS